MNETQSYMTGGGVMLGIGAGFFFMPNVFAFVGCVIGGIGLGLVASSLIKTK